MPVTSAYAGLPPWRKQKQREDWKEGFRWKASVGYNEKTGRYYATGGWTAYTKDSYDKNPDKPHMVKMRLYNGRESWVPVGDVKEFYGFQELPQELVTGEMAEYASAAFQSDKGPNRYYSFTVGEGGGHITGMRYNPTYQVLEVSFRVNGDIVTFFRVPKELYSEFEMYSVRNLMSMGNDGKPRHVLGIEFWNMVRIRGSKHGARYQFTYGSSDAMQGQSSGKYADAAKRTMVNPGQPIDSVREAATTNSEQLPPAEKALNEQETAESRIKAALGSNKYMPVQQKRIEAMRHLIMDKYGVGSNQHREFAEAAERDWAHVMEVATRLGVRGVRIE